MIFFLDWWAGIEGLHHVLPPWPLHSPTSLQNLPMTLNSGLMYVKWPSQPSGTWHRSPAIFTHDVKQEKLNFMAEYLSWLPGCTMENKQSWCIALWTTDHAFIWPSGLGGVTKQNNYSSCILFNIFKNNKNVTRSTTMVYTRKHHWVNFGSLHCGVELLSYSTEYVSEGQGR